MLRKRAVAVALTALLSPITFGLGLGTLKTSSALNEPFDARIDIVGATAQDFDALTVKLADSRQFERAGVARTAALLNLRFDVVTADSGGDFIRISSKDPVREPFLNFLLEINWANGRMVREYTVLLDPPLYDRNRQKPLFAAPVAAPAPAATAPTAPAAPAAGPATPGAAPSMTAGGEIGPVEANDTAWGLALAHRPDSSVSVQQMMLALLRTNPDAFVNQNVNQLRRGAVLKLPTQAELAALSQAEAVAEIHRQHQLWQEYRQGAAGQAVARPEGAPEAAAPSGTPETPAPADDARLELAAPEGGERPGTPGGVAGDGLDEALAAEDRDARAQENSELQAKLAEADQIIDLLQRQVQIKDEELAALQARVGGEPAQAEAPTPAAPEGAAGQRLDDALDEALDAPLDDTPAAGATDDVAEAPEPPAPPAAEDVTEAPASPAVTVPPVAEKPAEKPVKKPAKKPEVAVAPPPVAPPAETGWRAALDGMLPEHLRSAIPGGGLSVLGIAATLLALLFFGVVKAVAGRGEKAITPTSRPAATATAAAATASAATSAPTAGADDLLATREDLTPFDPGKPDPEQFQRTMEATAEQLSAAPEEDPLEEVNVYLAYERFDQAEELVRKVIAKYPDEHKYKLRLLEIYYSAGNKPAYEQAARELQDAVGTSSPLWESAVAMWSEMSPERALFAPGAVAEDTGGRDASAFVDITGDTAGGATMSMPPGGDDMLSSTAVGLTNNYTQTAATLDFDLGDTLATAGEAGQMLDLTSSEADDAGVIDLTATTDESVLADMNDMLDITTGGAAAAGLATAQDDVFDISGEDLAAAAPDAGEPLDLLDVTKTGGIGLEPGEALMDVTSPRGGTTPPDSAEAATINAVADALAQEFDISDTVAPAFQPKALTEEAPPAGETDDFSLDFDIEGLALDAETVVQPRPDSPTKDEQTALEDFDLTLDTDLDPTAIGGAATDLDIALGDSPVLDFDLAEPEAPTASAESEVEFDLALQDTTDFENLAIDDTLELPKSSAARAGMRPVDAASESLEDLTRSMEASIAGLDLDDDKDTDDGLDLALDSGDSGLDLEFGLDDIGAELGQDLGQDLDDLNELDTLALDPGELHRAADAITDRTVAIPRDPDTEFQSAFDETDTKLNLAKAYIELGDADGARAILKEVAADGSGDQQAEAQRLLSQLA